MNTVSENIFRELDFFAASFVLGMILVFAYDCLRIFRRLARHGAVWISLEDLGYWIITAFVVFGMLYQKNDGLIRGFSIGGIVLGMLLYNQLISPYTIRYITLFLKKLIHIMANICDIVFTPFRKLSKAAGKKAEGIIRRQRKFTKYLKKRLKKLKKEIKIGISKK